MPARGSSLRQPQSPIRRRTRRAGFVTVTSRSRSAGSPRVATADTARRGSAMEGPWEYADLSQAPQESRQWPISGRPVGAEHKVVGAVEFVGSRSRARRRLTWSMASSWPIHLLRRRRLGHGSFPRPDAMTRVHAAAASSTSGVTADSGPRRHLSTMLPWCARSSDATHPILDVDTGVPTHHPGAALLT